MMKILNISLDNKSNTQVQSFLNYAFSLQKQKIEVVNLTTYSIKNKYKIKKSLIIPNILLLNYLSIIWLKLLIFFIKPNLIIAHDNKAVKLVKQASKTIKLVGVCQNFNVRDILKCDFIIAVNNKIYDYLINKKFSKDQIIIIPNMLRINNKFEHKLLGQKVTIGVMCKLEYKKGIDTLLYALSKLKLSNNPQSNHDIHLIIAGRGSYKNELKKLVKKLNLEKYVSFIGWVDHKSSFFELIDILCLPAFHEPFGNIILEAMSYSVPVISSTTEGASEIIHHRINGLLFKTGSAEDLANKILYTLVNPSEIARYTEDAYNKVYSKYHISAIEHHIANYIENIINDNKVQRI